MEKTVLQVDGITCLDCAQKFEQEVRRLPGVSGATLNALTGKLTVEGRVDVDAIRRLGRAENYVVNPPTPAAPAAQQPHDAQAANPSLAELEDELFPLPAGEEDHYAQPHSTQADTAQSHFSEAGSNQIDSSQADSSHADSSVFVSGGFLPGSGNG